MTKDEALRMALEALDFFEDTAICQADTNIATEAITAIKEALVQEQEPVTNDLLRRAWDALDAFKQAYPENWNQEDEQVLEDLMKTDLKLSGVKLKWVGLTDEEIAQGCKESWITEEAWKSAVWWAEAKLKEKNT